MKKIVLCGGGSAGHIVPNLALLDDLKKHFDEIHYICSDSEFDIKYLANNKLIIHQIPVVKLERKFCLKNILIPFKLLKSIKICKSILKNIEPSIVFSKGGFVGLPVIIASKQLKIPSIIHESDYTLGLSNRLALPYVKLLLTSFDSPKIKSNKKICVGSPIRKDIKNFNKKEVEEIILKYKLNNGKKNILVIGGSLGAHFFNDFFIINSQSLCEKYNIILITGNQNTITKKTPHNFLQFKFIEKIENYYNLADIVITRGGSNALFEQLWLSKLIIIIPLPKLNSRGDQIENATYFESKGLVYTIKQEECNIDILFDKLKLLIANAEKIKRNQTKFNLTIGNENIVKTIINVTNSK